nr:flagellar hook-length control protein FliK [Saccharofermentans sp.]
ANVTAGVDAGRGKISDAPGFSEAMNNAKQDVANGRDNRFENKAQTETDRDSTKATRTVVESPRNKEIKSEEPVIKDPIANEEDMKELTEEVAKEVAAIVNAISSILEVDTQDIMTAMEDLGITEVDLLDPVSIKDLCMELTGTSDSISLLTDGDLYDKVSRIATASEDAGNKIIADFGMTKENIEGIFDDETFEQDVKSAIADLTVKSEAEDLPEDMNLSENVKINDQMPIQDTEVENEAVTEPAVNTERAVTAGTEAQTVTVEVNRDTEVAPEPLVRETVKEEDEAAKPLPARQAQQAQQSQQAQTGSVTETFKPMVKSENSSMTGEEEAPQNLMRFAESETVNAGVSQQATVVTTEVNNLGEVVETVRTYANTDADRIMSQVTESIRVNYTADTTSMEMQLHPASLGTVNMHIASTGGVVTAHIMVENEAVRAALESQLITLQQTFEEQGQKVEAVEVSVANYDLNRGGSSETGGDGRDRGTSGTGRVGARRRINLNDLDEEGLEELSEDEKLTADMMARSGNSVDYTA